MKYFLLLLMMISCQRKELDSCNQWQVKNGKRYCVVGTIIWREMEKPRFMKEIEDLRKNPRMLGSQK